MAYLSSQPVSQPAIMTIKINQGPSFVAGSPQEAAFIARRATRGELSVLHFVLCVNGKAFASSTIPLW